MGHSHENLKLPQAVLTDLFAAVVDPVILNPGCTLESPGGLLENTSTLAQFLETLIWGRAHTVGWLAGGFVLLSLKSASIDSNRKPGLRTIELCH